jgi:hypothetical protein
MRRVIASFALFAVLAEIHTAIEASVWQTIKNVGSKTAGAIKATGTSLINTGKSTGNVFNRYVGTAVADRFQGRGSSNDTANLKNIIYYMQQFKNNISSSANSQLNYITSKFHTTSEDMSLLISYYIFAKNSEKLFSIVEPILSKIRTDQATLLGNSELTENAESNLQNSLQALLSNGVKAVQAVFQSSAVTLLTVVRKLSENGEIPQTNIQTLYNQISALTSTPLFGTISSLTTNINNILGSTDSNDQIVALVNNILLIQKVLLITQTYINGGNVVEQIEKMLQECNYYSGQPEEETEDENNATSGVVIPYQNPYGTTNTSGKSSKELVLYQNPYGTNTKGEEDDEDEDEEDE